MKINELRVGNYIYYCDEIYKVDLRCIYNHMDDEQDDAYQPIPLTEEILLKCEIDEDINVEFDKILGYYVVYLEDSFCLNSVKLYHLHQLQNLYYALTNDELRYNP
jgi:hypothetical protein